MSDDEKLKLLIEERTQKLLNTNKKLYEVNKDLEILIYKASNDLKGPLSTILGLVNVAKLQNTDEFPDGAGLGLYLAKNAFDQFNGKIKVYSNLK